MKVLVADPFEQSGLDGLAAAGCDVVFEPALKDDALATALRETRAEVLVVRSTKVTAPMMDGGDLALIVRAGAGYNTIDVTAASARGVYVSNCPGKNAAAVAELAIGLIIALDRRIADNVAELRAGRWDKSAFAKAKGLEGAHARPPRVRHDRTGGRPPGPGVRPRPCHLVTAVRRLDDGFDA